MHPAGVKYNLDGVSRLEGIMGCFNALGTVAFAYGGHNVVLEIQASMIYPCLWHCCLYFWQPHCVGI